MESVVIFLAGSSLVASIITGLVKRLVKKIILPQWGDVGVLCVLFVISLLIAVCVYAWEFIPANITTALVAIFTGAVSIYQVLYKAVYRKLIRKQLDKDDKK